jgi:hypothetical protein
MSTTSELNASNSESTNEAVAAMTNNENPTGASRKRKAVTPPPPSSSQPAAAAAARGLTSVPSSTDLAAMTVPGLASLVLKLANERDELDHQLKKARTGTLGGSKSNQTSAAAAVKPAALDVAVAPAARKFDVKAMKKRIAQKSIALIKKAGHKRNNKPVSELTECVPDEAAALDLFEGTMPISNTARMIKWNCDDKELILQWLDKTEQYIYPCKYADKVWHCGPGKPQHKAYCSYESLEAKFDKRTNTLTLKFKSIFNSLNVHPSEKGW